VAALALVVPTLAYPGESPADGGGRGLYLAFDVGAGTSGDMSTSDGFTTDLFGLGFVASGAVGYRWGMLSAEGEFLYQGYLVTDHSAAGTLRGPVGPSCFLCGRNVTGSLETVAFMLNLVVEPDLGSPVRPFIGGGIGVASVSAEYYVEETFLGFGGRRIGTLVDDRDAVFAYQAIAGLVFAGTENLDWVLKYRFFATGDLDLIDAFGNAFEHEGQQSHSGMIGIRWYI
jgi:opacity protein-like surface antigen